MKALMTVWDVADRLRLNPETVRTKTRRKEIPAMKTGSGRTCAYRYDPADIEEYIARLKRQQQTA